MSFDRSLPEGYRIVRKDVSKFFLATTGVA